MTERTDKLLKPKQLIFV